MTLSDISVRRPVFAAVLSLLLLLVGLVAFGRLPVRELPDIDPPVVSIDVTYPGASAQVIENRITQLIEDRISGIEGIENIVSRSRDGRSDITIEFAATRDIDAAANDVRDRVAGVLDDLPDDAQAPDIRKVDADAQPIMWLNLLHPTWERMQLTDYADRFLVDRFGAIDGVARVQIGGEARPSMRVWLDRQKLAALRFTPADVEQALRRQNVELPAGRVEGQTQNLTVRVARNFTTPQQFAQLIVGRGADGYLVRLGDVARIERAPENRYLYFSSNGQSGIGLGIVRQSGANTLAVAQEVKQQVDQLNKTLPEGLQLVVGADSSLFIERAIDNVWVTLAEAAVLVVLVIYVFLGSLRATIIPAITVPICIVATFAVLWAFGFSINLLTLLALVLAIGLVVDDAIVVLENIYFRIEQGESPLVAAFRGARQVGFAVIATTVVVCAVFVPVMFIAGNTGLLFRELAAAMIGAVAFSGFVALSLTPMLCSKLLKPVGEGGGHNRFTQWVDRQFARLSAAYRRALTKLIGRPWLVGGTAFALVAACVGLGATLNSELAPEEDVGTVFVSLTAAEGTGFQQMTRYVQGIEQQLLGMGEQGGVRRILARVPGGFGGEEFNTGGFTVFLMPWEDRTVTTRDVVDRIQGVIRRDPQVRGNASIPSSLSRGRGRPINFVIAGGTFEELAKARDAILKAAETNPGLVDLDSDYKETKPQILIDIDTVRAGDLGVPIADIGATLETMMGSRRVTTYVDQGEEYRVLVQATDSDRVSPEDLSNVYVRSTVTRELIPLSNLVNLRTVAEAGDLGRFDKLRAITISGNLAPGYTLGEALTWLEEQAAQRPEISRIGYRGESQAFKQTGSSLYIVLGLTVVLIFLVLAAQFESFVHPVVIILTVPLAMGGGLLGLFVMGGTLNLYSQVGIVMLVGLAAKNGILIVEFANQLRDEGKVFLDAIIEASERRLRPVLMTSIATVAGAVPLMIASGAGAGSRRAIGVVIVWGVSFATLLTLFVIPVFYVLLARRTQSPEAITRKLEAEMSAKPMPAE